jgi:hypothetical protein
LESHRKIDVQIPTALTFASQNVPVNTSELQLLFRTLISSMLFRSFMDGRAPV